MTRQKKIEYTSYCVADAVSEAMSEFEQLHSELLDWYDNLPESFQNGSKGDELNEAMDGLSHWEYVSLPGAIEDCADDEDAETMSCIGGVRFDFAPNRKKRQSRSDRCANACSLLSCAIDAMQSALADAEEAATVDETVGDRFAETRDEIASACVELQDVIDNAESVSFPRMYG